MARNVLVFFCLVIVVLVQLSVAPPPPPGGGDKPCNPYYMCNSVQGNTFKWFTYYYEQCDNKPAFCAWYKKCYQQNYNQNYYCGAYCLGNCPETPNNAPGGFWKCLNSYTGKPEVTYTFWNSWVNMNGGCTGNVPYGR